MVMLGQESSDAKIKKHGIVMLKRERFVLKTKGDEFTFRRNKGYQR